MTGMTRNVRESEFDAMRKRAEAAEAHCERLRGALQRMVDEAAHLAGFSESTERVVLAALKETPSQSFAAIRAEAGREGFKAGMSRATRTELPPDSRSKNKIAEAYADQIRRQGDEY